MEQRKSYLTPDDIALRLFYRIRVWTKQHIVIQVLGEEGSFGKLIIYFPVEEFKVEWNLLIYNRKQIFLRTREALRTMGSILRKYYD